MRKPLDYFVRCLFEKKINFTDLLGIYVGYLEHQEKEGKSDITEAALLLAMWENPSLNKGSHIQLVNRTKALIEKSGVFPTQEGKDHV